MKKKPKPNKYLYWAPRVLAILFTIFISLFAFDVFIEDYTFWQMIGAFLIHLVPTYILIITLLIAWKWEHIGGAIFMLLGLYYLYIAWGMFAPLTYLIMVVPVFLIGILFLLNKFLAKH